MSTRPASPDLENALATIPTQLRSRLIKYYLGVHKAYAEGKYDHAGQHAGKFCEVMLRCLQDRLTGTSLALGQKIPNFKTDCERLGNIQGAPESLRIVIPRCLVFLYTMRNKRDIGHAGGDVDANRIDAATYVRLCDWCVSELLRVVHTLSLEDAQALLDAMSVRQVPQVWSVGGKHRVLVNGMSAKDKALLLLYSTPATTVLAEDLWSWTKHPYFSNFKRDVIRPLDDECLIEYDRDTEAVVLSPTGARYVEDNLLDQHS